MHVPAVLWDVLVALGAGVAREVAMWALWGRLLAVLALAALSGLVCTLCCRARADVASGAESDSERGMYIEPSPLAKVGERL